MSSPGLVLVNPFFILVELVTSKYRTRCPPPLCVRSWPRGAPPCRGAVAGLGWGSGLAVRCALAQNEAAPSRWRGRSWESAPVTVRRRPPPLSCRPAPPRQVAAPRAAAQFLGSTGSGALGGPTRQTARARWSCSRSWSRPWAGLGWSHTSLLPAGPCWPPALPGRSRGTGRYSGGGRPGAHGRVQGRRPLREPWGTCCDLTPGPGRETAAPFPSFRFSVDSFQTALCLAARACLARSLEKNVSFHLCS